MQFVTHDFDRLQQIRVVGYDYRNVKPSQMRIVQQMSGKIYVRTLFFSLDNSCVLLWMSWRYNQCHRDFVGQEMAQVNRHVGKRSERPQEELLPHGLVRIVGTSRHQSGEVLYFAKGVLGQEEPAQSLWVEPAVGCIAESAIVEIEAVYVDM